MGYTSFHYGNAVAIKYSRDSNEAAVSQFHEWKGYSGAAYVNRLENRSQLNGRYNLDNDNRRLVE